MLAVSYTKFKLNFYKIGLLPVTNEYFIVDDQNKIMNITFNSLSCNIDFSKFKCGDSENSKPYSSSKSTSSYVECPTNNVKNQRNQMFLVWSDTNDTISTNTSIYRIYPQFVDIINGTDTGLYGEAVVMKLKLDKGIPKEIHNHLFCYRIENSTNATVSTINNLDNEISCSVLADRSEKGRATIAIELRYYFNGWIVNIGLFFVNIFSKTFL